MLKQLTSEKRDQGVTETGFNLDSLNLSSMTVLKNLDKIMSYD